MAGWDPAMVVVGSAGAVGSAVKGEEAAAVDAEERAGREAEEAPRAEEGPSVEGTAKAAEERVAWVASEEEKVGGVEEARVVAAVAVSSGAEVKVASVAMEEEELEVQVGTAVDSADLAGREVVEECLAR